MAESAVHWGETRKAALELRMIVPGTMGGSCGDSRVRAWARNTPSPLWGCPGVPVLLSTNHWGKKWQSVTKAKWKWSRKQAIYLVNMGRPGRHPPAKLIFQRKKIGSNDWYKAHLAASARYLFAPLNVGTEAPGGFPFPFSCKVW